LISETSSSGSTSVSISSPSVRPRSGDSAADSEDMSSILATADAVALPSAASIFSARAFPRSATSREIAFA
jgi:hypothetical protein